MTSIVELPLQVLLVVRLHRLFLLLQRRLARRVVDIHGMRRLDSLRKQLPLADSPVVELEQDAA